jgi:DNA-binding protein Fis
MSFAASAAGAETNDLSLADQERRLVVQALENTEGNQTQAARLLSITRDTLRYKMKKFSLR